MMNGLIFVVERNKICQFVQVNHVSMLADVPVGADVAVVIMG